MGWHSIPHRCRDSDTHRGCCSDRGMQHGPTSPCAHSRLASSSPRRASVSPSDSSPAQQLRDARTDGRHLGRGKAGERRCSGPSRGGGADFITGQERQNWFGARLGQRHGVSEPAPGGDARRAAGSELPR